VNAASAGDSAAPYALLLLELLFASQSDKIHRLETDMLRITNVTLRACVLRLTLLAIALACAPIPHSSAQNAPNDQASAVHGRVLNAVTSEPISRALVNLQGLNIATFTNDQGQFEFSLPHNTDPFVEVRKLGFLQDDHFPSNIPDSAADGSHELIVRLLPEAKIVGHIFVPGSDGDVRIQSQLLRREMVEGRETWSPQRSFMNWVDGEFRFYGLRPGTYKLITHEQIDEESMAIPGAQLYGYPPMYYPNTTDFSLSTPIALKAGETARVNLTVARMEYYRVRLGVENMPAGSANLNLSVYPMGHHGPGWSLGYNPREGTIDGILPDGNYTVEASTQGENGLFAILNFSVKGKRLERPTLTLLPAATISVRVHEEFQSSPSNFGVQEMAGGNSQVASRRYANVNVNLIPLDDLGTFRQGASSRMAENSQGQELTIPDVRPGHYQVDVNAGSGYVASIQSSGKDLSRQPLVVGLGSEVAPIEIVLRDNGAQLNGSLEEENDSAPSAGAVANAMRIVYLLPMYEGGRARNVQAWQGTFQINQLPAGNYLVVAFDRLRQDLPSGPGDAMQRLASKGQVIHVEPDEKVAVRVKVSPSEAE
jgi:hypothetical protein